MAPVYAIFLLICLPITIMLLTTTRQRPFAKPSHSPSLIRRCIGALSSTPEEPPWLAVYGDSLARGIFFDSVALFNGTQKDAPHPGHGANYSLDCALVEARPPLQRRKCGAFAFDGFLPTAGGGPVRVAHLDDANDASPAVGAAIDIVRLSFRLKTFTWEPAFDEPWLASLRRMRRLPDVLLLSSGIWDMQYPTEGGVELGVNALVVDETLGREGSRRVDETLGREGSRRVDETLGREGSRRVSSLELGANAFVVALRRFLTALRAAIGTARGQPRLLWLTVTAVSDAKLPLWKRPRMSTALARRYNELALPELRRAGVTPIDTFTSGAAHPELSTDGVHFPGPLSRHHAQLVWDAMCATPSAVVSASVVEPNAGAVMGTEPPKAIGELSSEHRRWRRHGRAERRRGREAAVNTL